MLTDFYNFAQIMAECDYRRMEQYDYNVAGHRFRVLADEGIELAEALAPYAPFAADAHVKAETALGTEAELDAGAPVFRLRVVSEEELAVPEGLVLEFDQDDDGSQIRLYRTPSGESWFEFLLWGKLAGRMLASADFREATLAVGEMGIGAGHSGFALNNALMVMYALRCARMGTALFHAAVVGYRGKGYLFLGKSGTGKSTHARLWLQHIPGTELVNDDNPVVRVMEDGTARVYGSPWSGKTPCYRNMDLPAGGFVQLEQAPVNEIRRLRGIAAYAALVPSISGKRWDRAIADGLHATENALAARVPVWHLRCLPDAAAARLCAETVNGTAS